MDEEMRIITTEKELEEFKNHCERLIMYLGLRDWDCVYIIREADDRNAGIEYNPSTRKALFILASNREEYKTLYELAKHEVLELLLADLCALLGPFYSDILIDNETHKVINRLVFAIDICKAKKENERERANRQYDLVKESWEILERK